eukprot:TRINITY_DN27777_c0_g1_i1.p1 TRINITY_DN27777_c0_g1~~TRINITY_DN27777_c0_g1_i1.p1  ORF type:complete len:400 (+),score=70.56 TRINITY_DN27777_c0_g1_i1:48-1247(+)
MAPLERCSTPPGSPTPSSTTSPSSDTSSTGDPDISISDREVREVWAWNLDEEFNNLLSAASVDASGGVILALDMEFPGFLRQDPRTTARAARYQAIRENVDRLRPIQLGIAIAAEDGSPGSLRGVWNFNLKFDIDIDLHTQKSVEFLRAAGIDFSRHKKEGIDGTMLGKKLANSGLVGQRAPWWVTFSGTYDLAYLLKLLTGCCPLPRDYSAFDIALDSFCPRHHDLRGELPYGSLDSLARKLEIKRHGRAHTAGSDALLTLDMFMKVVGGSKGAAEASAAQKWASWAETTTYCDSASAGSATPWYQHGWGSGHYWEQVRWDHVHSGYHFQQPQHHYPSPWPSTYPLGVPWAQRAPPAASHLPALSGGIPTPSSAFWAGAAAAAASRAATELRKGQISI